MASNTEDINLLNRLIGITIDSADGYREAAEDVSNPELKAIFKRRARERLSAFASLQSQVRALGGEPEDEGSLLASMHRVFLDLRSKVRDGDLAVIDEVERGEDRIQSRYEEVIRNGKLSTSSLAVAQHAYRSVRAAHEQMSQLKQSLHSLHG